ncbi:flavoprotein-like protein [Baffinella frigidus]|nr:flavoprotein-like protein [Cryptophyta sp. CCMP2293]
MQVRVLPTVGVAAAAALVAAAAYLYSARVGRKSGGGFRIGTAPARVGASKSSKKEEVKEEAPRPKVDVYFGSQTGTAEEYAKQVQREGDDRGLDVTVIDLELYDKSRVSSATAVFLVATYGEGEPTDNGRDFHDWLVSEEDEAVLSNLSFAVFGLGNTQYEHFNSFGKAVPPLPMRNTEVDENCGRLGGTRLLNLALGDDDNDMRDTFELWLEKVREMMS